MNLNNEEEDLFFNQQCLELAKLLRTEQTEHFLRLYDSLPSEWNGPREYLQLETAKEHIRQLQELNENEFELLYQRGISNGETEGDHQVIIMSNLPIQSAVIHNDDEQKMTTNSRITSPSILKLQQNIERTTANDQAYDEIHDVRPKHFPYIKTNNDQSNTKSRRLQSITNNDMIQNNCRTRTSVDSFVQMNLKHETPSIDIKLEDYKKTIAPMSTNKSSNSTNNLPPVPLSVNTNESKQRDIVSFESTKKHHYHKNSMKDKSHEESDLNCFSKNDDDNNNNRQHSRSSSTASDSSTSNNCRRQIGKIESSSTNPFRTSYSNDDLSDQTRESTDQPLLQSIKLNNTLEHGKLISNNGFDSHGSSTATKSSSDNSGSARTGSGSDSEEERHLQTSVLPTKKSSPYPNQPAPRTKLSTFDDTPTIVLNQTNDNRPSQYDGRISSLPKQDSYQLVKVNTNDEHPVRASQLPRFKLPATDDPNSNITSGNDIHSNSTQRSQQTNLSSSSHQNRNNTERHEQYNTNHSNSSRKPQTRPTKKRKQSQQQDIIRTELIPGHRGDRDVDELVMFIDGNSSSKQQQQQQRQNSAPLRPTDTNKLRSTSSLPDTNSNGSTSRRKSRKPIKIVQESNENKSLNLDEDTQSIGFIDVDDDITTARHLINNTSYNEQNSLPNDDESHSNTVDIDSTNDSNTTNGETSLPDWFEATRNISPENDDVDLFSLSSTTLNNSNSEIISEPFVTVTHRRRLTKERRQDINPSSRSSRFPPSSTNDKRRFQTSLSTQNGIIRPTIRNSLSNITPFVSTTTKEESNATTPPPPPPPSLPPPASSAPPPSVSNNITEQSSPRLSSHSSSSSLSSLLKKQSKVPPVVFLNKSLDIELNGVSFGFDVDKPSTPPATTGKEKENETETNTLSSNSPTVSTQSNEILTNSKYSSSRRSYQQQQRHNRGPLFYSGSDIRPHHHRNYPTQPPVPQSPYIDPLLLQYNQQRLAANYSQQLAYMNLIRSQYLSYQPQYVLVPTTTRNDDDKTVDDETVQTSEQLQEPLVVYTTLPTQQGQIYFHPTKKSYNDLEQQQQQSPLPTVYPTQFFYPTQQHLIPSNTAYFQPISSTQSPSLLIDSKSQQDDTDDDEDDDYEKSTGVFHQTRQQSSSHIMSNALKLVYSQERRNTQTDNFNLDQLTAYLAMKWTDTIDHFERGDGEILLIDDQ